MLLRVQANNERWNVHHLLADPDVTLADEHTGMVNRFGQAQLKDLGLQPSLQEILNLQAQNVIQLHLALIQHPNSNKSSQQSVAFKQTPRILLDQELKLIGEYGLRNKREVWRVKFTLAKIRKAARELLT
ncbi:hypothetical protein P7M63_23660, partial [Vibrio parahaemolyticus]|nr:hypothetical protein [Vibrio parahaemolyticus]